jgi:hypothetical protein
VVGTNAAAITETIPPNSSVAFPLLTIVYFRQGGAGALSVAGGAGVTVTAAAGTTATARGQGSVIGAVQEVLDSWTIFGDTA